MVGRRLAALVLAVLVPGGHRSSTTTAPAPAWRLAWSDEFNGRDGSKPDPAHWTFDIGGTGWGNRELQYYTDRTPANVQIQSGALTIRALKEKYTGPDHVTREYTSARLHSMGRYAAKYGRFEARIKLSGGAGLWSAFWMLGDDFPRVGWPQSGEIDIVENIGREPSAIHGTIHGPGYSHAAGITSTYVLPGRQKVMEAFHIYAIEWEPGAIRFYVDGVLYRTMTPAELPARTRWVFDHPFSIIFNVAVGGDWPGNPDESTTFPQTMLVDYVRVYQKPAPSSD